MVAEQGTPGSDMLLRWLKYMTQEITTVTESWHISSFRSRCLHT